MNDFELLNRIKLFFSEEINKGRILSWAQLYQYTIQFDCDHELVKSIEIWYYKIINFEILKDLPQDLEELFILNAEQTFIKTASLREEIYHEYTQTDFDILYHFLVLKYEQNWNRQNPFCSFNIIHEKLNYRISLIHKDLCPHKQHKAFIRRLRKVPIELTKYDQPELLEKLILKKRNILISGSTGSGKTTLLNALLNIIPKEDHLVVLEDTYELSSPHNRTSRLLADAEKLDDLLSYSLRMSPDRIVLGEIRSKEILTFILGMNTGHKGILTSIHANSAKDAINRLTILYATYTKTKMNYSTMMKLISSNIDYVIHIEDKKIKEIIEVYGSENESLFFDSCYQNQIAT